MRFLGCQHPSYVLSIREVGVTPSVVMVIVAGVPVDGVVTLEFPAQLVRVQTATRTVRLKEGRQGRAAGVKEHSCSRTPTEWDCQAVTGTGISQGVGCQMTGDCGGLLASEIMGADKGSRGTATRGKGKSSIQSATPLVH